MAVVLMEGFDHLSSTQVSLKGWNYDQGSMVAGRFGGQAISSSGTLTGFGKGLPGSYTTAVCGFAFKNNQAASANSQFAFRNGAASGGTVVVAMRFVTSGPNTVLGLYNAAGTQLALGTTPYLGLSTWVYAEIKVVVSATVGTVELRLNGASTAECSATGVNTGALDITSVSWQWVNGGVHYLDDIYVVDTSGSAPTNTWLGDSRVETLYPSSNGTNTAWTGVYTDVDDPAVFDNDTTYISSATPNDLETYGMTNLSMATGTVFAVQTNLVARKDDAGLRTIAPVIRTGGTNYAGTTTAALGSSYLGYTQLYDRQDPVAADWSVTTVNGMEVGVKEVA